MKKIFFIIQTNRFNNFQKIGKNLILDRDAEIHLICTKLGYIFCVSSDMFGTVSHYFYFNFYSLSMFPLTDPINLTGQRNMTDPYDVHALLPHIQSMAHHIFLYPPTFTSLSTLTHTYVYYFNQQRITQSIDFNFLLSIYGCFKTS